MTKIIKHIGTKYHSGRYPWGSGNNSQQRTSDFLGLIASLKKEGLSNKEIAKGMGISTKSLIQNRTLAKAEIRAARESQANRLKAKGMSTSAIGRQMGINESSVRSLLDKAISERAAITKNTSKLIASEISKHGFTDIGLGVEATLGISRTKLLTAVKDLENQGYEVMTLYTKQLGTGKYTTVQVLSPPGMEYPDMYADRANVHVINAHSDDGGRVFKSQQPIQSVSGDRIHIRYDEEGGSGKDGVIELRRNVDDLNLGSAKYAQVRIGVNDTHYMKGMAVYSDDIPKGKDIVYNVKKSKSDFPRSEDIYKPMVDDANNPFGSTIKVGGQKGALNIVYDEGDWQEWSKTISSQILSKQTPALAKQQLDIAKEIRQNEYDEIMKLTNPAIKSHLLYQFADNADAASVHLKAAALPRQAHHVLLPVPGMSSKEVYAPMYRTGENVVLIRHPHGGVFEIPELVVNNRNPEAKKFMRNSIDAIGINAKVAQKLSGADFDGDAVIVIPNKQGQVRTAPSLKALKDFDPQISYKKYDGMPLMTEKTKQREMGKVSNLITDMTIKGATQNEIARAVRHSMVVIDAKKHNLNYKLSAEDNGIAQLKEKYQGGPTSGAATLLSRAKSEQRIDRRKEGQFLPDPISGKLRRVRTDPKTGEKLYEKTGKTYTNKRGKVITLQMKSKQMAEAKSAFELSSGTRMETIYAKYANETKALANKARLSASKTPKQKYDEKAYKAYKTEIQKLKAALRLVDRNRPLERKAQLVANKIYYAKLKANHDVDPDRKKKLRGQAITEARTRLGAKKPTITISSLQWTAIQLGAVSNTTMIRIINAADQEKLKALAMPRTSYKMTTAKESKARVMSAIGYTPAEIAQALGVSATTIVTTLS